MWRVCPSCHEGRGAAPAEEVAEGGLQVHKVAKWDSDSDSDESDDSQEDLLKA